MSIRRKATKRIKIGGVFLGGKTKIRVQSMCNIKTEDVKATVAQIHRLKDMGCEMIRIAIPDIGSARKIKEIKKKIRIPLIADIHYDYTLALECLNQEIDKIRINPGNIASDKLSLIAKRARALRIPIRIGINIGSLPKEISKRYGYSPQAMVKSAQKTIRLFEKLGFFKIVVSLKSSDILQTIEANRLFSKKSDYPLHLGITEAGTERAGLIKSSLGIGSLLLEGIGDTIRFSLSAPPEEEVLAAYSLLKSLGLRRGAILVSCPACGRAKINVPKVAQEIEKRIVNIKKSIKVGILGCFVNVDEAKIADIGVAGGQNCAILFRKGKVVKRISKNKIIPALLAEIKGIC